MYCESELLPPLGPGLLAASTPPVPAAIRATAKSAAMPRDFKTSPFGREVAERLRQERAESTGLQLDSIKARAVAGAASSRKKGFGVKSRGIVVLLTIGLMAAGTGGVLAGGNSGGNNGSSSNSQYKPGCGPPPLGINPSGTHTGAPGNPAACLNQPGRLP